MERNITYGTPEYAAVEKQAAVETVVNQTGQRYAKHSHEFEMKITGSFKSNEAWPRGYKTFFVLNSIEHEILTAHKYKYIKKFSLF